MMTPEMTALLAYLDESVADLRGAFDSVPAGRRDDAPDGRWSAAGVVEHLAKVERGVTVLIQRGLTAAPERPAGQVIDVAAELRGLDPLLDRTRRITAPERAQPAGTLGADAAWAAFVEGHAALRAMLLELGPTRDLTAGDHPHPALGRPLNWFQWAAFLGAHARRHAAQIRELPGQLSPE